MACSRCGQSNRVSRPVSTPSIIGRPGTNNIHPPVATPTSSGLPQNVIKNAINGLRYVPNK